MQSILRITLKLVAVLTGLVILAAIALKWVLDDPERFREPLADQLRSATGYSVSFQTLDWQVWPQFALKITDLRIPAAPAEVPLAEVKDLSVDINLIPLVFDGALTIDSVRVSSLMLNLVDFEDGRTNFDPPEAQDDLNQGGAAASNASGQTAFTLNELKIETLNVRYTDEAIAQIIDLQLDNLSGDFSEGLMVFTLNDVLNYSDSDLDLDFKGEGSGTLTFSPRTLMVTTDNLKASGQLVAMGLPGEPIEWSLSGQFDLDQDLAKINALNIDFFGLQSQVSGRLSGLTEPEIGLDLAIKTALIAPQKLSSFLPDAESNDHYLKTFSIGSRVLGTDVAPQFIELSGLINNTDLKGQATFNPAASEVALSLQLGRLDLTPLAVDSGAQASTSAPFDPETVIVPIDLLDDWVIDLELKAKEILWDDLTIDDAGLTLNNRNRKLAANVVGKLNAAPLDVGVQVDYSGKTLTTGKAQLSDFNLSSVLPDYNLGWLSLTTSLKFEGTTLGDLTSNLEGPMAMTLADGQVDITALKQAAQVIDQLTGTQSGAAIWPDQLAFDELIGKLSLSRGIESGQRITLDYQNLSLRADGGIDIYSDAMDYAIVMQLAASTTPPLKASGPLTQMAWPARCKGAFDAPLTTLCQVDRRQSRALVEDLARRALKKKATRLLDKSLEDKAPDALKSLLKGLLGK